jgi:hypothetical protein
MSIDELISEMKMEASKENYEKAITIKRILNKKQI